MKLTTAVFGDLVGILGTELGGGDSDCDGGDIESGDWERTEGAMGESLGFPSIDGLREGPYGVLVCGVRLGVKSSPWIDLMQTT